MKLLIIVVMYIIGNAVCIPLMNYSPMKSSKQTSSSLKMKSKLEVQLENERELLRLKDFKDLEMEKIHTMKEIEDMKMNITKQIEDKKSAVEYKKIAVENEKIAVEEKERRLKCVFALVNFIAIVIFGTQLRDGLLGRITTVNSMINDLKEGILKLTKSVHALVGGVILEVVIKNLARARSFLVSKLWR